MRFKISHRTYGRDGAWRMIYIVRGDHNNAWEVARRFSLDNPTQEVRVTPLP